MILSRYPLQDGCFIAFAGATGTASLDRRGLLEATVRFPAGFRTAGSIRIGTTFAPPAPQAALRALRDVAAAKTLADPRWDRTLLGDFQLGETNTAERQALDTAFGGHGSAL